MISNKKLSFSIIAVVAFMQGCASPTDTGNKGVEPSLKACPEQRAPMCTAEYRPVCATLRNESRTQYSNACSACSNSEVIGYRPGPCEAAK